jgi:hypothetical protein
MFACSWPCLPLPGRGPEDASEAAAPVLASPRARQSAFRSCPTCGASFQATHHRQTYCPDCRATRDRPNRNGVDPAPAPLSDLKERPLKIPNYEDSTVAQALEPPPLPWQTR